VKKHLEHIYDRLGVHDRQSAIRFAFDTLLGDSRL
jgi:DNA-binding NarL/FixJ family response regulator